MNYLGWFDDAPKKTTAQKVQEGVAAYKARFGSAPTLVLMNSIDLIEIPGIETRSETYIRRHNFWLGVREQ